MKKIIDYINKRSSNLNTLQISIDNYIYNVIECSESHVLIPLSNEGSGAVTKNYMKMMLLSEGSVDNGNVGKNLSSS